MHRLARALGPALAVCRRGGEWSVHAARPAAARRSGTGPRHPRPAWTGCGRARRPWTLQTSAPGWVGREIARRGSPGWRIRPGTLASDTQLAGYADRASIRPGEPLHLFVTTTAPSYTVRAYRLGGTAGCWPGWSRPRRCCGERCSRPGPRLPPDRDHAVAPLGHAGDHGLARGHVPAPAHRQPGPRLLHPRDRALDAVRGRLVVLNAVTTYQAYNAWGGYSLYGGPETASTRVRTPSASTGRTTRTAPASSPTTSRA